MHFILFVIHFMPWVGKILLKIFLAKMSVMEKPEQVVVLRTPRTKSEHMLFQSLSERAHICRPRERLLNLHSALAFIKNESQINPVLPTLN